MAICAKFLGYTSSMHPLAIARSTTVLVEPLVTCIIVFYHLIQKFTPKVLDFGGCRSLYRLPCRVDHTAGVDRIRYGCALTPYEVPTLPRLVATHVLPNSPINLRYM